MKLLSQLHNLDMIPDGDERFLRTYVGDEEPPTGTKYDVWVKPGYEYINYSSDIATASKPKLNNITLEGNISLAQIGISNATTSTPGLMKPGKGLEIDSIEAGQVNVKVDGTTTTVDTNGYLKATQYVLVPATTSTLGGVKIGDTVQAATDGTLNVKDASVSQKGVVKIDNTTIKINESGQIYAIPATIGTTDTITGDGTTSTFYIIHDLGTKNIIASVYDSNGKLVVVDITTTSNSTITVGFKNAPAVDTEYRVVIMGIKEVA